MKKKRIFWGTVLIVIGVGLLLDQLDILSFGKIFKLYWPSILIFVGLLNFFNRDSSKVGNIILIIIGLGLQINKLNLLDFNAFKLVWPIILILLGLKILFSRDSFFEIKFDFKNKDRNNN
ncbi:MAG TPA: DUF5668 domain-containing protein [Tissierellaceae bacterium]